MNDFDILGTGRSGLIKKTDGGYWAEECGKKTEIYLKWFTMYLTFFNCKYLDQLKSIDIGGFARTDTGGKNHFFIEKNDDLKFGYLKLGSNREQQVDFIDKENPDESSEFVHFRAGSNWDNQSIDYYKAKINCLDKNHIPEFYKEEQLEHPLMSRDGEHTFE
jgi:hypothetical protein